MRSTSQIRGHPVHPALIPFPFAFLIGAFLFDVAGYVTRRQEWSATAAHLIVAGIATGLLAAIPGFIDYLYTVPPKSTGKKRATKHMLANVSALGLFAIVWFLRGQAGTPPALWTLGIELIGSGLLAAGGWMGGTLVSRNQISVDHRYARAGKWREARIAGHVAKPVVGRKNDLEVDQMKLLHVNGRRIVLARTETGYVAFEDRCTHRGGSLAGGTMICGTVQCPWHGSQFDVRSGDVKAGPAKTKIKTFVIEEHGEEVRLIL